MRAATFALAVALSTAAWLTPRTAAADDIAKCVKASEEAQLLRDDGKYKRARELFVACTRDACPGIVKKDCTEWLAALDQSMPSVVISAKDGAGRDLTNVKVTVDGQPFADKLDGKPLALDPGEHALRFEAPGAAPVDDRLVMHAGEKNRALTVRLGPAPVAATPTPPEPAPTRGGGVPGAAIAALGAVGVVAIGSFAFFGLTGRSDVSDLRSSCAPNCDPSKVDTARGKLIIADISLGVGVVALGVATWMVLTSAASPPPARTGITGVDVRAVAGGGVAEIAARF